MIRCPSSSRSAPASQRWRRSPACSPTAAAQGNNQPENETGPGKPGTGNESWGELQPYLNSLKNRGSAPKIPQKYRKYWKAYLKNKKAQGKQGGGR